MTSRFQSLGVEFPFFVAPMVGLSHVGLRSLVRHYTPASLRPLLFTEMLSTRRLPSENMLTTEQVRIVAGDRGAVIPQILGNEERYIAPSLAKLAMLEPWGVDINMGCPVTHTLKHNWGFRLVGQADYAAAVVAMTKKHARVPVSVKLRGDLEALVQSSRDPGVQVGPVYDEQGAELLARFVQGLADAGADWVTVHPRPGKSKHRGAANWQLVAKLRRLVKLPVVANGDIQTASDALQVVGELGCDGAMFARVVCARPWILWQVAHALGILDQPPGVLHRTAPPTFGEEEGQEYIVAVLLLIDNLVEQGFAESDVCERIQFFCATGSRWYQFGHDFWKTTTKAKTVAGLRAAVVDYGERYANPSRARVTL